VVSTVTSVVFFGGVLLVCGAIEAAQAIWHRKQGHLFLHLLDATLAIILGFMFLRNPVSGALALTLVFALYLLVAGHSALSLPWPRAF
jgi:uncharacterized membrane protein HdeD (DUF308 family)